MAVPKSITVASPAPSPAPVPASSPDDAILALIERAARDPAVDIDKMERLFAMRERMLAQTAKAAYLSALAEMQAELPAAARKGTGHNNKKYARFEDIIEAIKESMQKHGFSLTFRIDQSQGDKVRITGVLGHRDGHSEQTDIVLSADNSGAKNAVQAWGSSVSYGKRYVAVTLLGIATEDDDDGQAGGSAGPISEEQATELMQLLQQHEADIPAFCKYFGIVAVAALPASQFERAKTAITSPKRKSK